jgi:biotin transport system substrate-specific component
MEKTIPQIILDRVIRGRAAVNMLTVIGASLVIALAAQVAIPIPFSPVPLTLQPLAVLLVGVTLGSVRGAAAAMLYLFEGMSGLPVFAQGHGGIVWLVGPTAGYLYAYPLAAWLAGWFSERGWGSNRARAVAGMAVAMTVIYAGGWSWLALQVGARAAFAMGIAPFFLADVVKVALGAALLPQLERVARRLS